MDSPKQKVLTNHNNAAKKNTALTRPFHTPDGVLVQVYGTMVKRGDKLLPEFRLVKIKDKRNSSNRPLETEFRGHHKMNQCVKNLYFCCSALCDGREPRTSE